MQKLKKLISSTWPLWPNSKRLLLQKVANENSDPTNHKFNGELSNRVLFTSLCNTSSIIFTFFKKFYFFTFL